MTTKYLGPAATLDGKTVPADGLTVSYSEAQITQMRRHGHRFSSDGTQEPKSTPAQVNDAVVGNTSEADLSKAVKETVADKPKPTPAQVNDAVVGNTSEADLSKAVKETVADKK